MKVKVEIRSLTGLRGIAAIYVMLYHYFAGQAFSNPATTILAHGYLAVDLFFVLSGFVMALNYGGMFEASWSARTYWQFLGRRIARVYPLYLALTLVAAVLVIAGLQKLLPVHSFWPTLAANVAMVQSWGLLTNSLDGPAWSISSEWAAYLLFPLLLGPTLFRSAAAACAAAVAGLAAVGVLCLVPVALQTKAFPAMLLDVHEPAFALPVIRCLAEFVLGLVAYRVSRSAPGYLRGASLAPLGLCGGLLLLLAIPKSDFFVVVLIPALIVSLTSVQSLPARLLGSRIFETLGLLSYSIYLTHDLMDVPMSWTRRLVEQHGFSHGQSFAAIVGVVLTAGASVACYRLIEQPGRRWLRLVFEGPRQRVAAASVM